MKRCQVMSGAHRCEFPAVLGLRRCAEHEALRQKALAEIAGRAQAADKGAA